MKQEDMEQVIHQFNHRCKIAMFVAPLFCSVDRYVNLFCNFATANLACVRRKEYQIRDLAEELMTDHDPGNTPTNRKAETRRKHSETLLRSAQASPGSFKTVVDLALSLSRDWDEEQTKAKKKIRIVAHHA